MLLSSLMGGISFPRTILICKARRYFLQGVHQGDIKSNTRSGRILRLVRIYQRTSMKDHRKTLLFPPSSKDNHSSTARISICQILIIFLLRGVGRGAITGTEGELTTGWEDTVTSVLGGVSSVDCLSWVGCSSASNSSSSEFIIFQCGYLLNSSAVVTPWVTPAKSTPAALAVAASTVLSPM